MTRKLILAVVVAVGLVTLFSTAEAGFGEGTAAYNRGDYETALREFRPLAEQGRDSAQFWLGRMYHFGQGVPQDHVEAVKWYRKSAEQGNMITQSALAAMYHNGQGVPQDDAEAVKWLRKSAEQGWFMAQFDLATMYGQGRGVTQDYAEAVRWFRKAAGQGNGQAQISLGFMYDEGLGVPQDDAEAVKWYRLAAEQGYAGAQVNLGVMYANGQGVTQDEAEAMRWYRLAAEQGLAEAQNNLGNMYDKGEGVPQDEAEAARWYRLAAEQGYANAQSLLGFMYLNGQGVTQDYAEAVRWWRLAAEQEFASAQVNLGVMYANGQGVPQDNAEAMRWYRKAAAQGDAAAQVNLGAMYAKGRGVPQDYVQAHMWFNLAAAQGDEDAKKRRSIAAKYMTPEQIAEAQRLARGWRPRSSPEGTTGVDFSSIADEQSRSGKLPDAKSNLEPRGVEFVRSADGHFYIDATVNDTPVRLLLDTGATTVLLAASDAAAVGINLRNLKFDEPFSTANGVVHGAGVVLDYIKVGDIVLRDVEASVSRGLTDVSLLGMSFLNRLNSYRVDSNILTLIPRYAPSAPSTAPAATIRPPAAVASADPTAALAAAEAALILTREERRLIQRGLNAAGHDAGVEDGIFDRGTRRALWGWQEASNAEGTGYLNGAQAKALIAAGRAARVSPPPSAGGSQVAVGVYPAPAPVSTCAFR